MTNATDIKTEINRLTPLETAGGECARGQKNVLVAMLWSQPHK